MKSKEDILYELQKENPYSIPTYKAMDRYAEQMAIDFLIWAVDNYSVHCEGFNINEFNNGRESTVWSTDGDEIPISKLYQIYLKSLEK